MTTKLNRAMHAYTARAQFHDSEKLDAIIEAVREEERAKFPALVEAARAIVLLASRFEVRGHVGHLTRLSDINLACEWSSRNEPDHHRISIALRELGVPPPEVLFPYRAASFDARAACAAFVAACQEHCGRSVPPVSGPWSDISIALRSLDQEAYDAAFVGAKASR